MTREEQLEGELKAAQERYTMAAQEVERLRAKLGVMNLEVTMATSYDHQMLKAELSAVAEERDRAYRLFPPLLKGVALALKGPEPELSSHDWSDLPEVAKKVVAKRDDYKARKDEAYRERNKVVAAFAKLCRSLGMAAGLMKHEGEDWEPDWRTLLFIKLPDGSQLTWHFHDSEVDQLKGFDFYPNMKWDGHDTPEKYRRLAEFDYDLDGGQKEWIKPDPACKHEFSEGEKCFKCDGNKFAPEKAKTLKQIQHEEEIGSEEPIDPHEPKFPIP